LGGLFTADIVHTSTRRQGISNANVQIFVATNFKTSPVAFPRCDSIVTIPDNFSRPELELTPFSSDSYVSPATLYPLPKAAPRKSSTRRSRPGKTRIWTNTPEKIALEEREKEKQCKKQKCYSSKPKRQIKRKQRLFESNSAKAKTTNQKKTKTF